jgi:hypothetical protein
MVGTLVKLCPTLTSTLLIDLDGEALADGTHQALGMVGWLDKIAQLRMELVLMQQIASDMNKSKRASTLFVVSFLVPETKTIAQVTSCRRA